MKEDIVEAFQNPEAVTRRCSIKKVFLKISKKFTWKDLCKSLFFNKVRGLSLLVLALFIVLVKKYDGRLMKPICIDQPSFCISYPREISKIFNITSKYFSIFNKQAEWCI